MSGEIAEVFNELLFGSGALIGLILIISIALLVSLKAKYSSAIFIVILLFFAMDYLDKITASTMHAWYFLISLISILFLGTILYRDLRK